MTLQQAYLFNAIYLAVMVGVAFFTRATTRRIAGSLIAGGVVGVMLISIIAFCMHAGWWRFVMPLELYFLVVAWVGFTIGGFVYLLTWRIARRFGLTGLAVVGIILAVLGPVRDYTYMRLFPEWGAYGPGIAPFLAISMTYVLILVVGHWVMWMVAGPSGADRLARAGC